MNSRTLLAYYRLTKPRVLYANSLTAVAGYLFAASYFNDFDLTVFLGLTIGTLLVIASACAVNNVLDRDIDQKMSRTKTRPSVNGDVSVLGASLFGTLLVVLGTVVLFMTTSLIVTLLGLLGWLVYVVGYGVFGKRLSVHGTLVGSVSGAIPIMTGYIALSGQFDSAAIILFLILFFWQEPAFYAISIYLRSDYKSAHIPVMSVVAGNKKTAQQIFIYTLFFVITSLLLTPLGYTGWIYFFSMLTIGLLWLKVAYMGLGLQDHALWARKRMFRSSLIVMMAICVLLPLGPLLP